MIAADTTACQFAQHLVDKNYAAAHALLCPETQSAWTPDGLQKHFEDMMDAQDPLCCQMVMEMDQWPDKTEGDLGWVYVAINADMFCEAVTVVVCEIAGQPKIRQVEWGRP